MAEPVSLQAFLGAVPPAICLQETWPDRVWSSASTWRWPRITS